MPAWKRNLVIIWISQFLAMAGMSTVVPFLPLFVRELGVNTLADTALWSGLVFAAPFFVSFLITPVWGAMGDKYGRKLMTVRAVIGLSISLILIGFSNSTVELLIYRILQGLLSGFYPAAMALVAAGSPKEKTAFALGMVQSANTSGNIIGPLIGGVVSDLFGFRAVFIFVGSLIGLTGLLILFFVEEKKETKPQEKSFTFLQNWQFAFQSKPILIAGVFVLTVSLAVALLRPVFVLYIELFNIPSDILPTVTGLLYSILGIFSAISSYYLGKRIQPGRVKSYLITSTLLCGLMYLLHTIVPNVFWLIPVRIILGSAYGIILPVLFTIIMENSGHERKGGMMGIASSWQTLGNLIGPLISGTLAGIFGLKTIFLLAGILFILISISTSFFKVPIDYKYRH